jgi:hypothetical protein
LAGVVQDGCVVPSDSLTQINVCYNSAQGIAALIFTLCTLASMRLAQLAKRALFVGGLRS